MQSSLLKAENGNVPIVLLPINDLKPHEKGSPVYLKLLKQEISSDGILKYPIIADEKTHVILDGMHRWLALKSLGYSLIPVILVDAFENPLVRVGSRRIHRYTFDSGDGITIERVILAGLRGHLMKPRSTRHFFSFSKFQKINIPLHMLGKCASQDVTKYVAKMARHECELAVKQWQEEINEELDFLTKRKQEVEREMEDFLKRARNLEGNLSNS
jgi:gas vesicle protein